MKRISMLLTGLIAACAVLSGCGSSASSVMPESKAAYDTGNYAAAEEAYEYSDDIYEYEEPMEARETADTSGGDVPTDSEIMSNSNRKLIKTVNISAETREFDTLIANVTERINALGGYAESTDIHGNSYDSYSERSAYIVARIPADKLSQFVQGITEESNITSKSESAEDVTLQYADVEAHKESLKIEQERLNQLLEQADTLENIIELENRLTEVRYEIESYESRLRTMNNQVVYSTVNLSVREVKEYSPEPIEELSFGQRLSRGFIDSCEDAWDLIQDFVIGFVSFLPTLLVALIILSVIGLIIFGIIRAIMAIVKRSGAKNRTPKKPARGKVVAKAVDTQPASAPEAGNAPAADAEAQKNTEGGKENG